jgi:hypothetical protein
MEKSRSEHVQWCKERAYEYLEKGDVMAAYTSMCSDLEKHPATENHPAIGLGIMLSLNGHLDTVEEMRKFIDGFN